VIDPMFDVKTLAPYLARMLVTLAVVIVAVAAGRSLWRHYQVEPWTRDGRVRADVIAVTPDVSGLVTDVSVAQNQSVRRGQPLFSVDRERYALALRQAEAGLAAQRAVNAQAAREVARNRSLGDLVAGESAEQSRARLEQGAAALAQLAAARDVAALNLRRTEVFSPADGTLSDLNLHRGDYVTAGKPVLGLIDASTFRVEGYFEETKLRGVRIGQPATVKIMGEPAPLHGRVQSIAAGVEDRDRTAGPNLLPSVNPTFSWVRLAQRIPVRVVLDNPPANLALIAGRTATVSIDPAATQTAAVR
jgi:multidrug resistance efflux pump